MGSKKRAPELRDEGEVVGRSPVEMPITFEAFSAHVRVLALQSGMVDEQNVEFWEKQTNLPRRADQVAVQLFIERQDDATLRMYLVAMHDVGAVVWRVPENG